MRLAALRRLTTRVYHVIRIPDPHPSRPPEEDLLQLLTRQRATRPMWVRLPVILVLAVALAAFFGPASVITGAAAWVILVWRWGHMDWWPGRLLGPLVALWWSASPAQLGVYGTAPVLALVLFATWFLMPAELDETEGATAGERPPELERPARQADTTTFTSAGVGAQGAWEPSQPSAGQATVVDDEPSSPADSLTAAVFAGCAKIMAAPLEHPVEIPPPPDAPPGKGPTIRKAPTDPARHVRITYAADRDERGRPRIEEAALVCGMGFQGTKREELRHQLSFVLGGTLLREDYSQGYNRPVFRPYPPLPTLDQLPWVPRPLPREQAIIGMTDPSSEDTIAIDGLVMRLVDFNTDPHVLVCGSTGSQKSGDIRSIIMQLLANDPEARAIFISGKRGEFTPLAGRQVLLVAETGPDALRAMRLVHAHFRGRQDAFGKVAERAGDDGWSAAGASFPPLYVVVDESVHIAHELHGTSYRRLLLDVVTQSRRDRIHFTFGAQRNDTKAAGLPGVDGLITQQCPLRIGKKGFDEVGARMVFGDASVGREVENVPGRGTICRVGGQPARIQSMPLWNLADPKLPRAEYQRLLSVLPAKLDDAELWRGWMPGDGFSFDADPAGFGGSTDDDEAPAQQAPPFRVIKSEPAPAAHRPPTPEPARRAATGEGGPPSPPQPTATTRF